MENLIRKELEKTAEILKWANVQNISMLKNFIENESERPLICIGSGGSYSTCRFIALMYSTKKALGTAFTPYSVYSISDDVLSKSKVLLISNSGHNKDIAAIAKRCMRVNPEWTANLTTADSEKNELKKIINERNSFNFSSDIKDGFISINSVTVNYALVLRAFKNSFDIQFHNSEDEGVFDYKNIKHYIVLYGGWGEPAAIDLESKLIESGIATCAVSDYRNFCHGRFIFVSNHCGHPKKIEVPDDCAVIFFTTPRELSFAEKIRNILPDRCKKILLETFSEGAEASLELMLQASLLAGYIAAQKSINPLSPPNYGGIDKRSPVQIPFISDLKKSGPLTI